VCVRVYGGGEGEGEGEFGCCESKLINLVPLSKREITSTKTHENSSDYNGLTEVCGEEEKEDYNDEPKKGKCFNRVFFTWWSWRPLLT
jgi:hypothetical protein